MKSTPAFFSAFFATCLLTLFASCTPAASSGDPSLPNIGPLGGEVTSADGRVKLIVPAGAVDENLRLTVDPHSGQNAPLGALSGVYEIGPAGTQFNFPATVSFLYEPDSLSAAAPEDLRVATADNGSWRNLDSPRLDSDESTVSGKTGHLSLFALIAVPGVGIHDGGPTPDAGDAENDAGSFSDAGNPSMDAGGSVVDGGLSPADSGDICQLTLCGTECVDLNANARHCGICDRDCGSQSCTLGMCEPDTRAFDFNITNGTSHRPEAIAADAANIYWGTAVNPGFAIHKMPKAGGPAELLAAGTETFPHTMITDGTTLWFAAGGARSVPTAGGATTELCGGSAHHYTQDGTFLYYLVGTLRKVLLSASNGDCGGGATLLHADPRGGSFAVDADHIYVGHSMSSILDRAPKSGGNPELLATFSDPSCSDANVQSVLVEGSILYVATTCSVWSVPKTGGTPVKIETLITNGAGIQDLVQDAGHLYASIYDESGTDRIVAVPKSGGPSFVLASSSARPGRMVQDATHIYWIAGTADSGDGRILRTPK
jgi:hypothetical protein